MTSPLQCANCGAPLSSDHPADHKYCEKCFSGMGGWESQAIAVSPRLFLTEVRARAHWPVPRRYLPVRHPPGTLDRQRSRTAYLEPSHGPGVSGQSRRPEMMKVRRQGSAGRLGTIWSVDFALTGPIGMRP
jgi:hypothetical protein